ncbi:tyrosine-protein phosphatase [Nocardia miyunensis]|uniref:tyrosine-protein phosphatase n=1 Tax=Nocardia miyunensis TaxID=282684 RepID=UPI0008301364|nr:tyrosine-protein phosphatase [Nocardia miyunensis]
MNTVRADHFLISGTFNYRDVGQLHTSRGRNLRSGVLLRSAHLCRIDARGQETLRELGVRTVHDLRGPREIDHLGADALPADVRLRLTPFDSAIGGQPPHEAAAERDGLAEMLAVYRSFPGMSEAHAALLAIAESILRGDGAVLVHCAAGKDRTGWAIATLLRAIGVSEADILAEFLLSNHAAEALAADVERNSGGRLRLPPEVLGVRPEYLAAGTDSMHDLHTDLNGYFTAIGLTEDLRARLRDRLLE